MGYKRGPGCLASLPWGDKVHWAKMGGGRGAGRLGSSPWGSRVQQAWWRGGTRTPGLYLCPGLAWLQEGAIPQSHSLPLSPVPPSTAMEADLKDVELNELEPEKQPMTPASPGSPEKNGAVKVKVAEDEEDEGAPKFTGLSKEELLRAAGTPGWVRARWALLILFWLGWLGMLAGAVLIIVQAPRCRPLPPQTWWHKGGLYRIQPMEAFRDSKGGNAGDLAGERTQASGAWQPSGLSPSCPQETRRPGTPFCTGPADPIALPERRENPGVQGRGLAPPNLTQQGCAAFHEGGEKPGARLPALC